MLFAIVETGAKQYKVSVGQFFEVEKLEVEEGQKVVLSNVLLISRDGSVQVGTPFVNGASVECEVLKNDRSEKVIIFKKKRRANYRRKKGHRQHFSRLKVLSIIG